jgi:hypothetical protein
MKKKILIIFIILILCIIFITLGKYCILKKLSSSSQELFENSSNFKITITTKMANQDATSTEIYYKDDIYLIKYINPNEEDTWEMKNNKTGEIKTSIQDSEFNELLISQIYDSLCIKTDLMKIKSEDNYYVYKLNNCGDYYSKDTGLLEKVINYNEDEEYESLNTEITYKYEFDIVTDDDMQVF